MNTDWSEVPLDTVRRPEVWLHKTATPLEVLQGTAEDGDELTTFVSSASHSSNECNLTLNWHRELYGAAQPRIGHIIEIRMDDKSLWIGIIDSISEYRLETGARSLGVVARSRDASPNWRDVQRVSDIYPAGTQFSYIARQIAAMLGLSGPEIVLPDVAAYTVHSNTQLANVNAWTMLEMLMHPLGAQPWVDALGRLRAISRDTQRTPDIEIPYDRLKSINGSRSQSAATAVRVKWLDPALTRVTQQDQALGQATITAGFFQPRVTQEVWWSSDHKLRAEGSYLVVKQSCNSGLLKVADEQYQQTSEYSGKVILRNTYWSPILVVGTLVAAKAAGALPDYTTTLGGPTIPTGKIAQALITLLAATTMASVGTGVYEIRGQPFDYVHSYNTTEAYDDAAPEWSQKIIEIGNDFIGSAEMAQAYAVRELIYAAKVATRYRVTIVDDPRIECGDILLLPDGSHLYVEDYSRDLTWGAAATLDVSGYLAS